MRQLYGPEKVTHVITYSTIKAKRPSTTLPACSITPCTWASACPRWCRATPLKLRQVLEQQPGKEELYNPDFADAYKNDEDARRIIDTALSIEGLTRGEGVHACAV